MNKIPSQIRDLPNNSLYRALNRYGIDAEPDVIDQWKKKYC